MEQEVVSRPAARVSASRRSSARRSTRAIRADAEKKVRAGLLMAAIAKKNEFKVTDEDIEKGYAELAEETGKNVAKLQASSTARSRSATSSSA